MWCYTLFPKVLNMSLTAGIVIVFVLLTRLPLRKAPKIFSYALWAVVLFRLLCPVSFSSDLSLLGVFHAPTVTNGSIVYIPADIVHKTNPEVNLPLPGVSEIINKSLPQGVEQTVADPLEAPMAIATLLWLGGIAVMLVYCTASLLFLKRKLVGALLLRENIYLDEHLATPFVMGVIRPKIYLPSTFSGREREYIILHEQTHIRRFDHIVRLVSFLALALHWFNPLVWVAFILSGKDMEMSCDEAVMKKMEGDIRADYSALLLSLATGRKIVVGTPLAFGEGDTKSRIKNVMNYKKPGFWVVIAAVIVCIAVAVLLLANPAKTMELPGAPSVLSIDMEQFNEYESLGAVTVSDRGDIETVLSALSGARKTLRQSVNDYPVRKNYLVVKINLSGERRTLCLYSEGNAYLIEEPYVGIYRSTRDSSVTLYKIYTGSGGVISEDSSQQTSESWELISKADVNGDGLKEVFYLDKNQMDSGPWVTLRVHDGSGNEIWSEDAGIPHGGWNSLFLCEQDGEYYLLRYNPGMWQGYCTYTYSLFTLEGGAEHVVRSNSLEFDINGTRELDAPKMVAFADEVNALLRKSTLLLSSEGGNYSFGPAAPDQFLERYSWLDQTPELYADGDDLETRLVKYSEYAVSNHRQQKARG